MTNKYRGAVTRTALLSTVILLSANHCIPYLGAGAKNNLIRVAVLNRVDQVTITGVKNRSYGDHQVTANDPLPLYFRSRNNRIFINGKPYRGEVEVRKDGGQLRVINILKMEDYLKGVVPCEIGSINDRTIEVGKAQAVAARTYAYAHRDRHQDLGFDVYATVQDQVYEGIRIEDDLINKAVDQTRGLVITADNAAIDAKYHSTCGGITADFNDAWPGNGPPYLVSVVCGYCGKSPYYEWRKAYARHSFFTHLRSRLPNAGVVLGDSELIKNIVLFKNRKTGRVVKINLLTTTQTHEIDVNNIRTLFGDSTDPGNLLKSNFFDLAATADSIIIQGHGWGHGVGMCQFGAIEMARQGKKFKQILQHYYPKTRIKKK